VKRISLISIAVLLVAAILFNSCGSGSSPSSAFNKCIKAAKKGDIKTFSKYVVDGDKLYQQYKNSSKEDKKMAVNMVQMMLGGLTEYKYKILDKKIDGDRAKLKVEIEVMGVKAPTEFSMLKQNGTWKLNMGTY